MNSSSGGSRLEKLLALLEGGTSAAVRKAAGRQIANIAAAHPAQLPSLLRKVSTFTGSKTWDTRVAAGDFSVKEVLEKGTALLASAGQEFDEAEEAATAQERLVMQRRNLKKRLGLGGQMDALLDTADLVNDEDLLVETRRNSQHGASVSKSQQGASELLDQMAGLSARERNKLKRQMKRSGSARLESLPSAKRTKAGPGPEAAAVPTAEANNAKGDAEAWKGIVGGSWPFQALYDQLCLDVLHVQWEVRHGAAVAVREILRSHAGCAAVHSPVAPEPTGWAAPGGSGKMHLLPVTAQAAAAAAAANQACLEDCVVRLLCVLALDRFGDFVSDQVVAPVRETAAQALGATLRPLPASALTRLIPNLQQLVGSKHWEVRHGGLLGLKYLLAARPDLGHVLLPLGLPAAMVGFQDRDDDVRAVSAEALVPVAAALAASPEEAVAPVRSILWDILLDVEELSPSTGSVMQLLTHLHSHASPGHTTALLPALLPRLWPFFRHTLSSVRLAVALGQLAYKWQPDGQSPVSLQIMRALMTQSATWHQLGSLAVVYWAREGSAAEVPPAVKERLLRLLAAAAVTVGPNGAVEPYLELAPYYAKMRLETMAILQQGAAVGWDIAAFIGNPNTDAFVFSLTPETASVLARAVAAVPQLPVELAPSQQQLAASAANLAVLEGFWHGSVAACVAAAVVQAGSLPAKLNGVVQPLMGSLRKETDANMRAVVARALAELLAQCIQRKPSPNDRVVKNLCTMACGDVRETPQAATPDSPDALEQAVTTAPAAAPASEGEEDPAAAAARLARQGAEAALTAIATRLEVVIPALLRYAVPMLEGGESDDARRGGVALIAQLVMQLNTQLVAYSILLVVPLMGRMSDPLLAVRRMATAAFAAVVALLPLAQGLDAPSGLSEQQVEAWQHDRGFLAQLLDNSKVEDYVLPVKIAGELRRYQQEGISWLAFLRRCGLHGILADDMGLGKTLQATAIMAASAVERRGAGLPDLPSLIVCPPTLVGHWAHEIVKFVDVLRPLAYQGPPAVRAALRSQVAQHNVVVMSYDSLRSDIDWVEKQAWQYCVLDEGHIIRNPKSMITKACKRVVAQHRVLLSGTPIQNNVLELWSLFDFLMPGFLGSEESFNALYGKALRVAKVSKRGSKEAQAGLLAVEGLHKKIMPFVMRRTKDAVLKDLPPKIIQDVYCDASPLQQRLYEDFAESEASKQIAGALTEACGADSTAAKAPHVFQALQYLRKLCSHPLLVLNPAIPAHQAAVEATLGAAAGGPAGPADWGQALPSLRALQHAPKLLALKELLQECGIGMDSSPGSAAEEDALAEPQAGHRVLVFAQLKSFLDLVERDVLRPLGVTFLRLDGSVEATQRFSLVQRFNGDPTVEVMLLTTHVGGLGLNLTAADTVIFLEHDWNPMKDLQAMDRAHRLGQKCTVNVYRLLMRNTLEEKIMGLQRFKLDVAAAVVNQDNVSLATMDAGKLLDLFSLKEGEKGGQRGAGGQNGAAAAAGGASAAAGAPGGGGKAGQGGMKAVLENLEELWDESQYAEEFSLDGFMSKLK
ncbi:hypothetical protein WJX72_000353 [[Myrmecia] bisecta]|uniref:TATA-binding protein-associated factor 172 n=1 Tax=[Myrmecia] bisecta TaxID=41462 RepID=A0AAW1QPY6_9CHLO